ncbi:MAG: DUF3405 domain-containing protein [Cyclobacteriaceae bacterium]
MPKKIAYLILTRGPQQVYSSLYKGLSKMESKESSVFILLDDDHNNRFSSDEPIIAFDQSKINSLDIPLFRGGNIGFGNTHLPLLYFYRLYPDFDYYWVIEDDVRFNGRYSTFFDEVNTHAADFVAAKIRHHHEMPDFFMWDWIQKDGDDVPDSEKLWSFNPIYRMSQNALKTVIKCYDKGWVGHFEILLPTILKAEGNSLVDFGGEGKYTPDSLVNKYYQLGSKFKQTHRYRPPHFWMTKRNKVYHPIKTKRKAFQAFSRMVYLKTKALVKG